MKIDFHQHFWKFEPQRDLWINEEMKVLQKDFLPENLLPELVQNNIDGTILVQSDQSEADTKFLIEKGNGNGFIKGIVGWVGLCSIEIEQRLQYFKQWDIGKGFRHVLQGEKNRAYMLQREFIRGIAALNKYGYTYDLLILPDQIIHAKELVNQFPDQKFVLDHIAKPDIKGKNINGWKRELLKLAEHQNLCCKLSGMVTECDWCNWKKNDLLPYIDAVTEAFTPDRILFGSDWPVCLLAASYGEVLQIIQDYYSSFTSEEQDKIFGENAGSFYNLN